MPHRKPSLLLHSLCCEEQEHSTAHSPLFCFLRLRFEIFFYSTFLIPVISLPLFIEVLRRWCQIMTVFWPIGIGRFENIPPTFATSKINEFITPNFYAYDTQNFTLKSTRPHGYPTFLAPFAFCEIARKPSYHRWNATASSILQPTKRQGPGHTHLRGLPERRPKNETQRYVSLNGQAWKEGASSYLIEGLQADTEYTVELFVKVLTQNTASYGQQKAKTAKPSAIANLLQEEQKGATLYDLSGRCQQELKVGINIIRTKEGKTKRILVR